jgi:peroxiredoxin
MGLRRRPAPQSVHLGATSAPGSADANVRHLQKPTDGTSTLTRAAAPSPQDDIDAHLGPLRKPTDLLAWRGNTEKGVRRAPRHRLSCANREIGVADRPSTDSLRGVELPAVKIDTINGTGVSLQAIAIHRLVLYAYPGASSTEGDSTRDEDALEHRAYRRCQETLRQRQVRVVAVSSQPRDDQVEEWHAHGIDHTMLRDPSLELADGLGLPTIVLGGKRCYDRATLIIEDRIIQHVFCPVKRAAMNPAQVLAWMALHGW